MPRSLRADRVRERKSALGKVSGVSRRNGCNFQGFSVLVKGHPYNYCQRYRRRPCADLHPSLTVMLAHKGKAWPIEITYLLISLAKRVNTSRQVERVAAHSTVPLITCGVFFLKPALHIPSIRHCHCTTTCSGFCPELPTVGLPTLESSTLKFVKQKLVPRYFHIR